MKFQSGHAKLTFNSHETRADSIKFKELIQGNWNFILLSSYCTDYEWLVKQFDGISPNVEINLIEHYDKNTGHAGIQRVFTNILSKPRTFNIVHPVFPKFPNYGVMHCKLMVLASNEFLRLVVSSANIMDFDYENVQNVPDLHSIYCFILVLFLFYCFIIALGRVCAGFTEITDNILLLIFVSAGLPILRCFKQTPRYFGRF
jgi:hypothetical protein